MPKRQMRVSPPGPAAPPPPPVAKPADSALARFASGAADWTGSSADFGLAALAITAWLATGPAFGFSDTWQLVINTSTTIVTFLMVFLIQRAQHKDARAVHLELNELVAAVRGPATGSSASRT